MKILTDVDGVLFDWDSEFTQWMVGRGYKIHDVLAYDLETRFRIKTKEASSLCETFNQSAEIGFLDAFKDSIKYTKKINEETGARFTCISSLSSNKAAQKLRTINLSVVFNDIFDDFIYLPCGAEKGDVLDQFAYTGMWWIEDKPENAEAGLSRGLNCILINHCYNIPQKVHPSIRRVNNWKEIHSLICK
jgi:hypothetical protein